MFGDNVGQDMSFAAIVAPRLGCNTAGNAPSHATNHSSPTVVASGSGVSASEICADRTARPRRGVTREHIRTRARSNSGGGERGVTGEGADADAEVRIPRSALGSVQRALASVHAAVGLRATLQAIAEGVTSSTPHTNVTVTTAREPDAVDLLRARSGARRRPEPARVVLAGRCTPAAAAGGESAALVAPGYRSALMPHQITARSFAGRNAGAGPSLSETV
jgi:hypothetical protein